MRIGRFNIIPNADRVAKTPGMWLTHTGTAIGVCNGDNFATFSAENNIENLADLCNLFYNYNPYAIPALHFYATKSWLDIIRLERYYNSMHSILQAALKKQIDELTPLPEFERYINYKIWPISNTQYRIRIRYSKCGFNAVIKLNNMSFLDAAIEFVLRRKSVMSKVLRLVKVMHARCYLQYVSVQTHHTTYQKRSFTIQYFNTYIG